MNTETLNLITSIAVVTIPVIFSFFVKLLTKNKKALDLIEILAPLAKDAVAAAEKLGIDKQLDGAAQKSEAVKKVLAALNSLGFTNTDKDLIKNAVEKAYVALKEDLDKAYNK